MPAFVSCHGGLSADRPETFVPYYITEIRYYSKADENLYQANEMGLLSRADLGMGDPNDRYAAGAKIPNYALSPNSSDDAAISTFFEPSGTKLYFIPGRTAMCTGDGKDDGGRPKACDEDARVHYCSGLLGTQAWSNSELQGEIVMLACRGVRGRTNAATREIGADSTDTGTVDAVVDFGNRFAAADDRGKAAMWDDPELPEGTKVMMLTHPTVAGWVAVRQAKGLIDTDGDLAVLSYYHSPEQAQHRRAFDADPTIAGSLGRARQRIAAFKALGNSDRYAQWPTLPETDRYYLAVRDAEIQTWSYEWGNRALLGLPEHAAPSDDQFLATAVNIEKQVQTLATAVDRLTGTEGDSEAIADITQLYGAIMTDVGALQSLAGQDLDRLRTAVGAHDSGAALGQALAVYSEGPDQQNLAAVNEATVTFHAWVGALS